MIRIRTGSRLHFGLLSIPGAASAWTNEEGQPTLPRRRFGGVGLMIDEPGIALSVEPGEAWHAEGPLAERALAFARKACDAIGSPQPLRLRLESAAPEHAGLGTGTQLGLAVARATIDADASRLATLVGRGRRSSLGVHGFQQGGFLVEGGKLDEASISPLLLRERFPDEWHVMLILLPGIVGAHGRRELDAFAHLAQQAPEDGVAETLCRIVLLGMLPALAEGDLRTFGEALYDFNRRAGASFRLSQGGVYAHPRLDALVRTIRAAGVPGVGQSSWGPAVFAIVPRDQASDLRGWLLRQSDLEPEAIVITRGRNQGAEVSEE